MVMVIRLLISVSYFFWLDRRRRLVHASQCLYCFNTDPLSMMEVVTLPPQGNWPGGMGSCQGVGGEIVVVFCSTEVVIPPPPDGIPV